MPDVVITLNRTDIGAAIDDALGAIELAPLVTGKQVAVKPNDTWASEDDRLESRSRIRSASCSARSFQPR
jgi:hypothetical protein